MSAIIVGVAFLSGTLVLTATVRAAMHVQASTTAPGLNVEVLPKEGYGGRVSLPDSLLARVAQIHGVARAEGEVEGPVELVGTDGTDVDATAVSVASSKVLRALHLKAGSYPVSDNQVVIDDATQQQQHWHIGQRIAIGAAGSGVSGNGATTFTIVGIAEADAEQGLSGTPVAAFTLTEAQHLIGMGATLSSIAVNAVHGVGPNVLAARISETLGPGYQVLTAAQIQNRAVNSDFRSFSLLSTILVVLGAIVLFVSAFLVVNTFSIVVAQRTRELGLLRCLGASRAQLMGSVLAESFLVGLIAACLGVALGIVGAVILLAVLPGAGLDLPSVSPAIHAVAVFIPIALGTGATLIASVFPALRSTSVPPVAALQNDPVGEAGRAARPRATIGAATFAVGLGLLLAGLFANISHEGDIVGAGAVFSFIGLASLSPLAARPLARALGWPLVAWRGLPAGLARLNAMRNPRRTASTAAALLVGVALVSFMAVITASARASATGNISSALRAGYVIEGDSGGTIPLGSGLVQKLQTDGALSTVIAVDFARFKIGGVDHSGFVVNPKTYQTVMDLGSVQGNVSALGPNTMAVSSPNANSEGWHLGERLSVSLGNGPPDQITICAIFSTGDAFGGILFSSVDQPVGLTGLTTTRIFVDGKSDLSNAVVTSSIASIIKDYPQAQIQSEGSLESAAVTQVNQIVNLITVILILAVLIGLVGIVNTLALSVLERTRELGLLRALGMSRAQIRTMVRHESMIVALLGAVAGIVVGLLLAWAMQYSLIDQGLNQLRIPVPTLIAYLVVAGACGVIAGILPARRAAELDILDAISSE
ncbi:MAG: FtsX-like permease family protein [Acidimicrobiales bacterium]